MAEKQKESKESREIAPFRGRGIPSMLEEMDRMFDRFMGRGFLPSWRPRFRWAEELEMPYPDVDIYEDENEVTLQAELPGVKKEDLNVDVSEDTITLSGEKKKEEKVEKKDYYRFERSYGSFSRSFALPSGVDSAKAKASFKDGILQIKVPKKEEAKKKKVKVEVQ